MMELERVRYQIELEVQRRLTEELKGKEFNQRWDLEWKIILSQK